jgi:DNA repair protein RecN (Recombination protein N)
MLLELRVENYAVIDHVIATFGPGLNLLTGETGAGKSLLIDALALLLGEKASADVVRHGAERAVVACVFESTPGAEAVLEANGIDPQGGEIILRREIGANGKGRVFVDNQPATVTVLRLLAPELALIHAQSESQAGFDGAQQRLLLDRFAGLSTEATATTYMAWRSAREKLTDLEQGEQDRLRMLDLWSFQRKEIREAHLQAGEDAALEAEKRVLANAEKLYAAAMLIFATLEDEEPSASGRLAAAARSADELLRYDATWADAVQQLAAARASVSDVAETARDYASKIQASPERLAEIEDRLALLDKLKRKYAAAGPQSSIDAVIAFGADVEQKLAEIENRDSLLAELRKQVDDAAVAFRAAAGKLSTTRAAAARKLEKQAEQHINQLAMKVKFAVAVTAEEAESHWTAQGWDTVECRVATAAGEPLKPLREIASGGEMSRILLALKVSVEEGAAGKSRKNILPRTLVFDEIDIGIGGRAAEAVGQKLKLLSRGQQVLCITHQPQIAAFADQHFAVDKREQGGRTRTSLRLLKDRERTEEVARMLSGAKLTDASLQHAEEMIAASR